MSKKDAAYILTDITFIPFMAGLGVLTGAVFNIEVNSFEDAMCCGALGMLILTFSALAVAVIGVTFFNWDLE